MLGSNGAAFVFGPQKGAKPEDLIRLDQNMEYTIKLYIDALHSHSSQAERNILFDSLANTPGTGAAGGLVAAMLACFRKAKIVNGMDYIGSLINLEE
jgi:glycerate 2-kinase